MNNARRKQIEKLSQKLEDLKADLEQILEDEQESFDNMPESFQESERGEKSQNSIDNLEYAVSSFDEVIEYLQEATE